MSCQNCYVSRYLCTYICLASGPKSQLLIFPNVALFHAIRLRSCLLFLHCLRNSLIGPSVLEAAAVTQGAQDQTRGYLKRLFRKLPTLRGKQESPASYHSPPSTQ